MPGSVSNGPLSGEQALRILVVDDNEDASETLALLLRQTGHEVRVAADGASAQTAAEEFRPEVVLLDIGLPGMDGWEVARRLRTLDLQGVRLVAISGYGLDEDRRRAREVGFDQYFTKPVSFATLREYLGQLPRRGA
jgi:DNA-binding response OmpR family regulator